MKALYKEINTLRILPLDFMESLGILLKYDNYDSEVLPIIEGYYRWAMGHEISFELGQDLYKALLLLGDTQHIQDYNTRLEVWKKNNG